MIAALVLAAGTSSRMGAPKQLLLLDDRPLLLHVIERARDGGLTEIVVVVGHEAVRVEAALAPLGDVRSVRVPAGEPLSASLKAGVDALSPDVGAVAVLLGDQPTISSAVIERTIAAFDANPAPFARPYYGGQPGHPVVSPGRSFPKSGSWRAMWGPVRCSTVTPPRGSISTAPRRPTWTRSRTTTGSCARMPADVPRRLRRGDPGPTD